MRKRTSTKPEQGSSDDEGQAGADEKAALRRAKNREAAKRVRQRRLNTIKTLTEQVRNLTAANCKLKQTVDALSEGKGTDLAPQEQPAPDTNIAITQVRLSDDTVPITGAAMHAATPGGAATSQPETGAVQQPRTLADAAACLLPTPIICNLLASLHQQQRDMLLHPGSVPLGALQQMQAMVDLQVTLQHNMEALLSAQRAAMQQQQAALAAAGLRLTEQQQQQVAAATSMAISAQQQTRALAMAQQQQQQGVALGAALPAAAQPQLLFALGGMQQPQQQPQPSPPEAAARQSPEAPSLQDVSHAAATPEDYMLPVVRVEASEAMQQSLLQQAGSAPRGTSRAEPAVSSSGPLSMPQVKSEPMHDNLGRLLANLPSIDSAFVVPIPGATGETTLVSADLEMLTSKFQILNSDFKMTSEELLKNVPVPNVQDGGAPRIVTWL